VIHDVFWAYLGYSFPKDDLCLCMFKGRNAVVVDIVGGFAAQSMVSSQD